MDKSLYSKLSKVCLKESPADFIFKDALIFDVYSGSFYPGDVAVKQGYIAGIGNGFPGKNCIDCKGKYLLPGFIDAHLHLESTMVSPNELISTAALFGTTTFIVDPHEACNVSGSAGIDYILQQSEKSPANVYLMLPSCVPATKIDDNGAVFSAKDMLPYLENPRILGLGEVMDAESVINSNQEIWDKLELMQGKIMDGHAPFLSKKDLSTYALSGIKTDHEAVDFSYALEEVRNGLHVHVREGSAARNLEAIIKGILKEGIDTHCFSFCTDDKHIEDILEEGHISHSIRKAIALGLPMEKAYQMATINTAECYHLHHLGAISPGKQADFVLLSDPEKVIIEKVFFKGKALEKEEKIFIPRCPKELKKTLHYRPLKEEDFHLPLLKQNSNVIGIMEGQITTKRFQVSFRRAANFEPAEYPDYQKIAAIERHKGSGKMSVAICHGYNIHQGAVASSVSHDSHNIIVIGDSDLDMSIAANELLRCQGGYTVVSQGKVFDTLPLPIMGLMTDCGFQEVSKHLVKMKQKLYEMGVAKGIDPFITLSFLALPVIPEIRITPRGLCLVKETKPRLLKN